MNPVNKYKYFKRTVEILTTRQDKVIVFNPEIGWVVTGSHTAPLKRDLLRLSPTELKRETLADDPAGIATWQALTVKHNLHQE